MRWTPSMMTKLAQVRDVRMRLAELELSHADQAAASSRAAEQQAREALAATMERSAAQAAQARQDLFAQVAGGRRGITQWQSVCKQAKSAVRMANGAVDEAVTQRVSKELECSRARGHWREARFDAERLRLLAERLAGDPQ